jgi:NIPSNAP
MAFYELRQYHVRPGKLAEWVRIMEEEIIPFQVSKGMVICGSFRGETDESVYVWIRRFASEAERERLYKAVYDSDHWKTKIAPRVPECLDREKMVVTRIVPTGKSTMQ